MSRAILGWSSIFILAIICMAGTLVGGNLSLLEDSAAEEPGDAFSKERYRERLISTRSKELKITKIRTRLCCEDSAAEEEAPAEEEDATIKRSRSRVLKARRHCRSKTVRKSRQCEKS